MAVYKAELQALCQSLEEENALLRDQVKELPFLHQTISAQAETILALKRLLESNQPTQTAAPQIDLQTTYDPNVSLVKHSESRYTIYSDGACAGNGSADAQGGWGTIVIDPYGQETELSGGEQGTTNNRMELTAAIKGLELVPPGEKAILISDSKYLIYGLAKGWAASWQRRNWVKTDGKPALNPDLWKALLTLSYQRKMSYKWVRGHSGNPYNERCDQLAVKAIELA